MNIALLLRKYPRVIHYVFVWSGLEKMDVVLYYDALATYCLQDYFYRLPFMEGLALAVTRLGDPRYSYVITFPLVYWLLGARAGYHVILAASVAEWCNIVLKW